MKLLHSADWHLDAPFTGRSPEEAEVLRRAQLRLPEQVAAAANRQGCQLLLLAGDLFDGPYTRASLDALRYALEDAAMPVFIAPGNHDFYGPESPWMEDFPGNVHLFKGNWESVSPPGLGCRVYGAAFTGPQAPALLEGFSAGDGEEYSIGLLHGDPLQADSPYCPVTAAQAEASNLDYLALGHIHQTGSFRRGRTLCAWPGCPMGRGFDETGPKGVVVAELGKETRAEFLPLDTPRFYDWTVAAEPDPEAALAAALPAGGSGDFFRVTLTGEQPAFSPEALAAKFPQFPHLELRDRTRPPLDLWAPAGEDTLEGILFRLLRQRLEDGQENATLAARICRKLLDGEEVALP